MHNFCPNWVQIVHLPQKRLFGKIDCYYCIPTAFFHATTFKKSSHRAYNKTESCIILAQTQCELLLETRIFWKSWPTLLWSSYCILSCYAISNGPTLPKKKVSLEKWLRLLFSSASSCHKTSKRSLENEFKTRLHDFGPNWVQITLAQKGSFFW